jgi:CO/xanthine dehydrogenase FAD-binding subunit
LKGRVEESRIVLGAVHVAPVVAKEAQEFLRGRQLDPETIEMAAGIAYQPAKPLDNADLVYSWRKRMARIEVVRALRELAGLPPGGLPSLPA